MVLVAGLSDCAIASTYGPLTTTADTNVDAATVAAGAVTVLESRVTAVCANSLPLIDAPVPSLIAV